MLRKIRLYGRLAKFLGKRVFEAEISSAAEAVRFLLANFPQLEGHMSDQHYRVSVGDYALTLDELHDPSGGQDIRIVPVISGAGGGGVGQILAGVALVAAAILLSPAVGILAPAFTLGSQAAFAIGSIGVSLILGGVSQLLTPVPQLPKEDKDPRKSFSFSGIQNTSRQGVPVPVVYGETVVGSITVSAGIDVARLKK